MSDNADVINGAYESFSRGDIPAVIATLDADVQWDVTESLPQGGSFQGPDAVGEFFQGLGEAWSDFSVEVEDVIQGGEHVVGVGRAHGKLRSGEPAGYGFAHVFTLTDGRITRFREYADPDAALTGGSS
jgi:ketosteroid isomerase-like protein